MAKNIYVGISSKARKMKAAYIGISGKARKIKKIYIGVGGKARLAYQSYIPVTGISVSWELGTKESYEKYPTYAIFTVSLTPSNATNPNPTWTCGEGLSIATYYYDKSSNYAKTDLPSNKRCVNALFGASYDNTYTLTVSADGVSKSVKIRNYRHNDKDGDKANGIYSITAV